MSISLMFKFMRIVQIPRRFECVVQQKWQKMLHLNLLLAKNI